MREVSEARKEATKNREELKSLRVGGTGGKNSGNGSEGPRDVGFADLLLELCEPV